MAGYGLKSVYARLALSVTFAFAVTAGGALKAGAHAGADDYPMIVPGPSGDAGPVSLRDGVYMLTVGGVNEAIQTGSDGVVVVDTGPAAASSEVLEQIRQVTHQPIRFIVDTSADAELIGGNASLASVGQNLGNQDFFNAQFVRGGDNTVSLPGKGDGAAVVARQNILTQMVSEPGANYSSAALPSDTFERRQYNFFLNDSFIAIVALPGAHSGSDSAVRFDRADVVVTGEVFDMTRFPVIDLGHGGGIQGELDALDQIANTLAVSNIPVLKATGATLIIPVRGPVSDEDDLVTYRDMVSTIRDRIKYYIDHGETLQQIHAANPARGYASRYGTDTGDWTTMDFVNAVYKSLMANRKLHHDGRNTNDE